MMTKKEKVIAIRKAYNLGPNSCIGCGGSAHAPGDKCPAIGLTCDHCNWKKHLEKVCFKKFLKSNESAPNYATSSSTTSQEENREDKKRKDGIEHVLGMTEALLLKDKAGQARKGQRKMPTSAFTRRRMVILDPACSLMEATKVISRRYVSARSRNM